jgi:hypothetical protein
MCREKKLKHVRKMFNYDGKMTPRSRALLSIELKYISPKIESTFRNVRIRRGEKFWNLFI